MLIEYDENKRQRTLDERGLDFAHAAQLFDGIHLTAVDDRTDYGEMRYISMGYLQGRLVVCVWTYRPIDAPTHRRIISMRRANDREIKKFTATIHR